MSKPTQEEVDAALAELYRELGWTEEDRAANEAACARWYRIREARDAVLEVAEMYGRASGYRRRLLASALLGRADALALVLAAEAEGETP